MKILHSVPKYGWVQPPMASTPSLHVSFTEGISYNNNNNNNNDSNNY